MRPTAPALRATDHKCPHCVWILTQLRSDEGKRLRRQGIDKFSGKEYALRDDNVSNTITTVTKDNYMALVKCDYNEIPWERVTEIHGDTFSLDDGRTFACKVRKLTPRECFRLMDVDEDDIDKIQSVVSNSQQYKMAGNSIVVACLTEIFRQLFNPEPPKPKRGTQLSLF